MPKVWKGFTFGITAKTVSPTKPLELDATPDSLMGRWNPVFPATGFDQFSDTFNRYGTRTLTFQ